MPSRGHAREVRTDAMLLREAGGDRPPSLALRPTRRTGSRLARGGSSRRRRSTAETFARAWLFPARFRDARDGSALPWLLGIAGSLLADAARKDRIETRARTAPPASRPGREAGYTEVDQPLSPRVPLAAYRRSLPTDGTRPTCVSSRSCPRRTRGAPGDPSHRRRFRCHARCGGWPFPSRRRNREEKLPPGPMGSPLSSSARPARARLRHTTARLGPFARSGDCWPARASVRRDPR